VSIHHGQDIATTTAAKAVDHTTDLNIATLPLTHPLFPQPLMQLALPSNINATLLTAPSSSSSTPQADEIPPPYAGQGSEAEWLQQREQQRKKYIMLLYTDEAGVERIYSKEQLIYYATLTYGFTPREEVAPCFHTGRRRLRHKNGVTHLMCSICGLKWREFSSQRIRDYQLDVLLAQDSAIEIEKMLAASSLVQVK